MPGSGGAGPKKKAHHPKPTIFMDDKFFYPLRIAPKRCSRRTCGAWRSVWASSTVPHLSSESTVVGAGVVHSSGHGYELTLRIHAHRISCASFAAFMFGSPAQCHWLTSESAIITTCLIVFWSVQHQIHEIYRGTTQLNQKLLCTKDWDKRIVIVRAGQIEQRPQTSLAVTSTISACSMQISCRRSWSLAIPNQFCRWLVWRRFWQSTLYVCSNQNRTERIAIVSTAPLEPWMSLFCISSQRHSSSHLFLLINLHKLCINPLVLKEEFLSFWPDCKPRLQSSDVFFKRRGQAFSLWLLRMHYLRIIKLETMLWPLQRLIYIPCIVRVETLASPNFNYVSRGQ